MFSSGLDGKMLGKNSCVTNDSERVWPQLLLMSIGSCMVFFMLLVSKICLTFTVNYRHMISIGQYLVLSMFAYFSNIIIGIFMSVTGAALLSNVSLLRIIGSILQMNNLLYCLHGVYYISYVKDLNYVTFI